MVYYSDNGRVTYLDYAEALAVAGIIKKPLLLQFAGIDCLKCKKMEEIVLNNPEVIEILKEDFVVASLYVDVQNIYLPGVDKYFSRTMRKKIETVGDKNADLQLTKFGSNAVPFYLFVDEKENLLLREGYGYDPDIDKFICQVKKAKETYKKNKK